MNPQIRPYRVEDAAAVHEAVQESLAQLQRWMPWAHEQYSVGDSQEWLTAQVAAFADRKAFEFAIVSGDGRYLGGCGLNQLDAANQRANLGYWVRTTATGHGIATAAVLSLREWAFANTELIRLEILVAAANLASRRVAVKAGATHEAVLRSRLMLHGMAHDAYLFAFIRSDGSDGSDRSDRSDRCDVKNAAELERGSSND